MSVNNIIRINDQVRRSGLCNADGLQIPLVTRLNVPFIEHMVKNSPHEKIVKYLKFGWPLGHNGTTIPNEPKRNHKGVTEFLEQTMQYLQSEKEKNRILGPFDEKVFRGKNGISPLNSVPRKNDSRRRFILDLSFPKRRGINDGIDKDVYQGEEVKLKYPTVDDLAQLILNRKAANPDADVLIWKRDLKSCYRQFQLCPGSVHLVGYKFNNKYWYDLVLAMGSTSSAQICQKITDMVSFVFKERYDDELKNFLDDFFSANVEDGARASFESLKELLDTMGIEESPEKACPPATQMVVLGILFDTVTMKISLSEEKLIELTRELEQWRQKTTCSMRQMQSLVGKLNFASSVVRSGRIYMARLINLLRNKKSHWAGQLALSPENLNDIQWWIEHVQLYNGVAMESLMVNKKWEAPANTWSSDSSGTGLGGWSFKTGHFFHYEFDETLQQNDINSLECLALVLCVRKWSDMCRGKRVLVYCDNQTTVTIINSGSAKSRFLQACLRELHHLCALNSAELRAIWFKTTDNDIADVLSRWSQSPKYPEKFRALTQGIKVTETRIEPEDLLFKYTSL